MCHMLWKITMSAESKEVMFVPEKLLRIYESINRFRQQRAYCDVVIKVRMDTVYAHGGILCAHSSYFRDVLKSIKGEKFIELLQFDPKSVKDCVDYMYTGNIEISFKNICAVAETARFLGIDGLITMCEKALKSYIDIERAMTVRKIACLYEYGGALEEARTFLCENFMGILKSDVFLRYTEDELAWLITNRSLPHHLVETCVWYAIVRWVKHDLEDRESAFPDLLRLIELDNLPITFMNENIRSEPMVMRSDTCMNFLLNHLFTRLTVGSSGEGWPFNDK